MNVLTIQRDFVLMYSWLREKAAKSSNTKESKAMKKLSRKERRAAKKFNKPTNDPFLNMRIWADRWDAELEAEMDEVFFGKRHD
jgi:hypothetical protein